MRFSNLEDWLQWQQGCHPSAIDLGLARVSEVGRALDLLQPAATVITVAGTNGKGSCVAALEAIATHAKMRVGAFTSPHLLRYNERIKIDSQQATDAQLCDAFASIDAARGNTSLTYFEFSTLAALFLFKKHHLDLWILEVGLGGRLDAANIIDADVAVITSIDIDHVEWLGSDRESIGFEKAGIMRRGKPAVCADANPPNSLLQHAQACGAPLARFGHEFGYYEQDEKVAFWSGAEVAAGVSVCLPKASLAAAYHVAHLLRLGDAPERALDSLQLPGRMQQYTLAGKRIILDVAHNPAATVHLAQQLQAFSSLGPAAAIVAMMADKSIEQTLAPLAGLISFWGLSTISGLPRAANTGQLTQALPEHSKAATYPSVTQALAALVASSEYPLIIVTGSFYTVAEAQLWLAEQRGFHETAG